MVAIAAGQTIQLENGEFKIAGAPSGGTLTVYAGSASVPMLGSYRAVNGTIFFKPRFPLSEGVKYRAVYEVPGRAPIEAVFDGPRPVAIPARVDHIYPSGSILPANLLKFYVAFSAPMSRGEAWKRIRLLDGNGHAIPNAFLEIDQELWDREMRRLTVLLDPGRVKRDLVPNKQLGAPIVEGRTYTLVIDRTLTDSHGAMLADNFVKTFRGGPADRTPPDPAKWKIDAPAAGSRNPLSLRFEKSMDYALAQRTIEVEGMRGTVSLGREEREWSFVPDQPWRAGTYRVAIDTTLEDICGNRIGRLFDRNEGDRERAPSGKVYLPFQIK